MEYEMRDLFIIPTLVYKYASAVKDSWVNHTSTGVYLLYHWYKFLLHVVAQFQRDFYDNWSENEDIVSCKWTKEIFMNSSDPALIKNMEDNYKELDGIENGGINYLNIYIDDFFNTSDLVITLLQEFFKKFSRDGVAKYSS